MMRLTRLLCGSCLLLSWACASAANHNQTSAGGTPASAGSPGAGGADSSGGFSSSGGATTGGAQACIPITNSDDAALGSGAVAIVAASDAQTCALMNDDTVRCWGYNHYGQLGNGTTIDSGSPVTVAGISNVLAVGSGANHSCAVLDDGSVKCWGFNNSGQLGNDSTADSLSPVAVADITDAVDVRGGYAHSCALLASGSIRCWGSNFFGQLGDGSETDSSVPALPVSGISTAVALSVGTYNDCAIIKGGTVRCWGENSYGQLGNGAQSDREPIPVAVSTISTAVKIAAGYGTSCAVLSDGTIQCWGYNDYGQAGIGAPTYYVLSPSPAKGITNAIAVATGRFHTCAALCDGSARCWGDNDYGQLGNGNVATYSSPAAVKNISTATSVALSDYHSCALLVDGSVQCWGINGYGELGNGSTSDPAMSSVPLPVVGF